MQIIQLPHVELSVPTNNINTVVALVLLTEVTYFYASPNKKWLGYFAKYVKPTPIHLPINFLEDFTKPLPFSFQLFRNIFVDHLTPLMQWLLHKYKCLWGVGCGGKDQSSSLYEGASHTFTLRLEQSSILYQKKKYISWWVNSCVLACFFSSTRISFNTFRGCYILIPIILLGSFTSGNMGLS